jgi:L-serine dehydratase
MGPRLAADIFRAKHPEAARYAVHFHGSLAATGKGHLSDKAVSEALAPKAVTFTWDIQPLPFHPNGLYLESFDSEAKKTASWTVFSIGGGELYDGESELGTPVETYPQNSMKEILAWSNDTCKDFWQLADEREGDLMWKHLSDVWKSMQASMERGLSAEGTLPGILRLKRRANSYLDKIKHHEKLLSPTARISAYALAVAEENASGSYIVTAPTCGSAGVVPAVLRYVSELIASDTQQILRALATAGLVGNIVKKNASISGAEVGCQGEIGTACAMAAAGAAWLLGGSSSQIEYAAEMGLEHHLGLTCDPVHGLVQIPCIERNAFAAMRALDCAEYALLSDGAHRISFDEVVATMYQTGLDMRNMYKETSAGGLAVFHKTD